MKESHAEDSLGGPEWSCVKLPDDVITEMQSILSRKLTD